MNITDERKESVDFSDGYYESGSALVVNKDDDSISDFDDLKGKLQHARKELPVSCGVKIMLMNTDLRQLFIRIL